MGWTPPPATASMCQSGSVIDHLNRGGIHMKVTTIGIDLAKSVFQSYEIAHLSPEFTLLRSHLFVAQRWAADLPYVGISRRGPRHFRSGVAKHYWRFGRLRSAGCRYLVRIVLIRDHEQIAVEDRDAVGESIHFALADSLATPVTTESSCRRRHVATADMAADVDKTIASVFKREVRHDGGSVVGGLPRVPLRDRRIRWREAASGFVELETVGDERQELRLVGSRCRSPPTNR